MADNTIDVRIKHASKTSTEWQAETKSLLKDELGYDSTNRKFKVGDGTSLWPALSYTNAENASSATNASTAQYAINANKASTATNAGTATYAINAGSAANADKAASATSARYSSTANYSKKAGTANLATNANSATNASTAAYAVSAANASTSEYSANAGTANYSTSAINASTANYSVNAGTATSATSADNANKATSATSASYATNANKAASATSAVYSSTANYGKQAGTATYAENANFTTNASTSDYAVKAQKDASGNIITSTYLTKASATGTYLAKTDASSTYETKTNASNKLTEAKNFATTAVANHNASTAAHSDIRTSIANLNTKLNNLANSDDTTLDQMAEVVEYIKDNRSIIEIIQEDKANQVDLDNHVNNKSNPHEVTKAQVGLGNVDNTADSAKNVKYATNAGTATYATNASTSTYASNANYANSADSASKAASATSARYATTATNAGYATSAGSATNASTADYSSKSASATSARYATTATNAGTASYSNNSAKAASATSATYSSTANYAKTAGSATKATQDGNGNTITSTYLPLAGGTMTGTLTLKGEVYTDSQTSGALNLNNSNIYGVNGIYMADACENASEGIQFYRGSNIVDSVWANSGTLYFTPNRTCGSTAANYTVIHSGNIGSQSVNYANSAGTATYSNNGAKAASATSATYSSTANYSKNGAKAASATSATYSSTANYGKQAGTATYSSKSASATSSVYCTTATIAKNARDTTNGTVTTFNYGASAITQPSYLAAWNGYELRAYDPKRLDYDYPYVHVATGTLNTAGVVCFCKITITSTYADAPIYFRMGKRGNTVADIWLKFTNSSTAAGHTVQYFTTTGTFKLAIVNAGSGIFYLYTYKSQYDVIEIIDFQMGQYMKSRITLEWQNTQSSAWDSNAQYATVGTGHIFGFGTMISATDYGTSLPTAGTKGRIFFKKA